MRDDRRLFRIISRLADRRVLLGGDGRGRSFLVERGGPAQGGKCLRHDHARQRHREYCSCKKSEIACHDPAPYTRSMRTAHFLKSVCRDMGSVASSVTLLISWLSSNHGTNTTPRGILSRPRVSSRVRMKPRRDCTLTSSPRRSLSADASSGWMKQSASGNAR